MTKSKDGFAIALAWPKTWCKQAGSWYEPITRFLGFNQNGYYQAGHAAIVLVESNGRCHYFDFGRYHAPFAQGRVRSALTDPELAILTQAKIQNHEIINFQEILIELASREACHGTGDLKASYCRIHFKLAWRQAIQLQESSPLPYGPFIRQGTNCSRFVRDVLLRGKPDYLLSLRLLLPFTVTPSPMANVRSLPNHFTIRMESCFNQPVLADVNRKVVLRAPKRPGHLSDTACWHAGEGAGSWFHIEKMGAFYQISRYTPLGQPEFFRHYQLTHHLEFNTQQPYQIIYPSHYQQVVALQEGEKHLFVPVSGVNNNLQHHKDKSRLYVQEI